MEFCFPNVHAGQTRVPGSSYPREILDGAFSDEANISYEQSLERMQKYSQPKPSCRRGKSTTYYYYYLV